VITVGASGTQAYTVALYQANGGQLMWVNTDYFSLALGSMQQQGSLTGMPALKNHVKKSKTKIK
jgi:hypothetical protein